MQELNEKEVARVSGGSFWSFVNDVWKCTPVGWAVNKYIDASQKSEENAKRWNDHVAEILARNPKAWVDANGSLHEPYK
ncbi:hypothetical protein E9536_40510 [Burkholderia sp. LS-044]|nr:hypothetical protein E9536_40510 [Burkholderia sp. LS-044]